MVPLAGSAGEESSLYEGRCTLLCTIAAAMPLTPGARLGPYVIRSPLGSGGMGEVYVARDTKLDRDVALKLLPWRAGNQ